MKKKRRRTRMREKQARSETARMSNHIVASANVSASDPYQVEDACISKPALDNMFEIRVADFESPPMVG